MAKKNFISQEFDKIISYRLPRFVKGKRHYVEFYAFDPEKGQLERIRKNFDGIKDVKERNKAALRFCNEVGKRLSEGWNPFVESKGSGEYTLFSEACEKYETYLDKLGKEGNMRPETILGYKSKIHMLSDWAETQRSSLYYSYQFTSRFISRFLDYIFIDRDNTVRTRNNYYNWLSSFCNYLMDKQYIKVNPMDNVQRMKIKANQKNREVIPDNVMDQIHDYLMTHNKHFLLACYFLHYVLIRPHEMTFIRIKDISIKKQTITLYGEHTKNHNDAVLTLPQKVLKLMLDLDIFSNPGDYYLFSYTPRFQPGMKYMSQKMFRDYWKGAVRKDLKLPDRYKFYSLKDTGVTNMLRANLDVLTVRDQARHSSILITDTYTPHDLKKANQFLLNYEGSF